MMPARRFVPLRCRIGGRGIAVWPVRRLLPARRDWLGRDVCATIRWPGRTRAGPRVAAGRGSPRPLRTLAARRPFAGFLFGKIGEAFASEPIDLAGN